jgi:cellulose synthase/poly-beta-1,6-N-acetylglucosamine synthase-like glycosyltransferase
VPVGGGVGFLAAQVRALLDQQLPDPFDVILACNSCDNVNCVALDWMVEAIGDDRVSVVAAHEQRGAGFARNVGASESEADVVAFCDADDLVAPGWLAALVSRASNDVAVGGYLDETRFAVRSQAGWRPPVTPGALPGFLGVPYIVSANMAVDRMRFESVGGFDTTLTRCEDIALSWTLRSRGVRLAFAPDAVIHYRHRVGMRALVKQHYRYGIGMAQVLQRYGVPSEGAPEHLSGLSALRPNGQPLEHRTFVGTVVRRGSLAAGRVVGLAAERGRHPVAQGLR